MEFDNDSKILKSRRVYNANAGELILDSPVNPDIL